MRTHMSAFENNVNAKELLNSLRGKERAKMLYAIEQASLAFDHDLANAANGYRDKRELVSKAANAVDDAIAAGLKAAEASVDAKLDELRALLAPHKVRSTANFLLQYSGMKFGYRFYDNLYDNLEWDISQALYNEYSKSLRKYRETLGSIKRSTVALTEEEKSEIQTIVAASRQLAAGLPNAAEGKVNAAGEIEVTA